MSEKNPIENDALRLAGIASGFLAPLIGLGGILLATQLSPEFSWLADPLSLLGTQGHPTQTVFNVSLQVTPIIAAPFGVGIWMAARNRYERIGVLGFGGSMLCLSGVGVFPMGMWQHAPVALGFFLLLTFALIVYGYGNVEAGLEKRGYATMALGAFNLVAWISWGVIAAVFWRELGIAFPELVGALVLAVWAVSTAVSPVFRYD